MRPWKDDWTVVTNFMGVTVLWAKNKLRIPIDASEPPLFISPSRKFHTAPNWEARGDFAITRISQSYSILCPHRTEFFCIQRSTVNLSAHESVTIEAVAPGILGLSELLAWPNGRPSSSQLQPGSQLRWSWVSFGHSLGLSWLELDLVSLATSANSKQVVVLLLCDYAVVFPEATEWILASWLDSLVSFGRCKFWFCNVAWVGSTVWPGL